MPRLPVGPANIAPPLRCERLEERSLLSSTTPYALFGDLVFAEPIPCEELPADGVVLEEGGTAIRYEETVPTLELIESREGLDDPWYYEEEYWDGAETYDEPAEDWYYEVEFPYEEEVYFEDAWYYEDESSDDSWYYEEETYYEDDSYYDDTWYDEDDLYFDETWYGDESWDNSWSDDTYTDESWDSEYEFVDAGDIAWEDIGEVSPTWNWSDVNVAATAGEFDDGMVYAMAWASGIATPDRPAAPATVDVVETLSPSIPTTEDDAGASIALALPPATTHDNAEAAPDVVVPQVGETRELPATSPHPVAEQAEAAPPALAPPSDSDDHLVGDESLELSEDLRVG